MSNTETEDVRNQTLQTFLYDNKAEYIDVVPKYWLDNEQPHYNIQLYISIVFLVICVPGNFSQLLVMVAYGRSVQIISWKS